MKRAAVYLRVSTVDQTTANQEPELREVAGRAGWEVVKVYKDHGISGSKGRDKRPQPKGRRRLVSPPKMPRPLPPKYTLLWLQVNR